MAKIKFLRNRIGGCVIQFFSFGFFGSIAIYILANSDPYYITNAHLLIPTWIAYFLAVLFLIIPIAVSFSNDYTEIDFKKNYINQYTKILFFKIGSKEITLPVIKYILFHYYYSGDDCAYEVSLVTENNKHIQIALSQSKRRIRKLAKMLTKINKKYPIIIKDVTKDQVINSLRFIKLTEKDYKIIKEEKTSVYTPINLIN